MKYIKSFLSAVLLLTGVATNAKGADEEQFERFLKEQEPPPPSFVEVRFRSMRGRLVPLYEGWQVVGDAE